MIYIYTIYTNTFGSHKEEKSVKIVYILVNRKVKKVKQTQTLHIHVYIYVRFEFRKGFFDIPKRIF